MVEGFPSLCLALSSIPKTIFFKHNSLTKSKDLYSHRPMSTVSISSFQNKL